MVAESREIPKINKNVSSHLTTVSYCVQQFKRNGESHDAALSAFSEQNVHEIANYRNY